MKRALIAGAVIAAALSFATAASASAFCAGFEAGWKAAFRNAGKLEQLTPLCPLPKLGQDTFEGGYQTGMLMALARL